MPQIPPIAPADEEDDSQMTSEQDEATETPEEESQEMDTEISCAAVDCKWNKMHKCDKATINVSAGPEVKCLSYETKGKLPAPPAAPPTMGGGMGVGMLPGMASSGGEY